MPFEYRPSLICGSFWDNKGSATPAIARAEIYIEVIVFITLTFHENRGVVHEEHEGISRLAKWSSCHLVSFVDKKQIRFDLWNDKVDPNDSESYRGFAFISG